MKLCVKNFQQRIWAFEIYPIKPWRNSTQNNKSDHPCLKIKDRKHRDATTVRETGIHKKMATMLASL